MASTTLLSPLQKTRAALLTGWVRAWMAIRRIRALEMGAWWLSDRLYNLALLIREGSESLTLHRLDDPTPEQIISNILSYNRRAAQQPKAPVTATHIAVVRCMDRKLDLNRIFGDLKFVDDIANPFGAVRPHIIEALKIAVLKHGVRAIFLLDHTGCAARSIAEGPEAEAFPLITAAVRQHEDHIGALLSDAVIDGAMRRHELAIVRGTVVTDTDELTQLWVYAAEAGCWRPLAASQDSI
jgi:carbonic anhydrase